ncbi:MAG: hypothetical protein MZU95_16145 [Desulfomicrobium escambiense]|nr:hypothetical protein [Desulfomicrobium escambiense]
MRRQPGAHGHQGAPQLMHLGRTGGRRWRQGRLDRRLQIPDQERQWREQPQRQPDNGHAQHDREHPERPEGQPGRFQGEVEGPVERQGQGHMAQHRRGGRRVRTPIFRGADGDHDTLAALRALLIPGRFGQKPAVAVKERHGQQIGELEPLVDESLGLLLRSHQQCIARLLGQDPCQFLRRSAA